MGDTEFVESIEFVYGVCVGVNGGQKNQFFIKTRAVLLAGRGHNPKFLRTQMVVAGSLALVTAFWIAHRS
jgi:hypothetical protein